MPEILPYILILACGLAVAGGTAELAKRQRAQGRYVLAGALLLAPIAILGIVFLTKNGTAAQDLPLAIFVSAAGFKVLIGRLQLADGRFRLLSRDLRVLAEERKECRFLRDPAQRNALLALMGTGPAAGFISLGISLAMFVPLHNLCGKLTAQPPGGFQLHFFLALILLTLVIPGIAYPQSLKTTRFKIKSLAALVFFGWAAAQTTETGLAFINGILAGYCFIDLYQRLKIGPTAAEALFAREAASELRDAAAAGFQLLTRDGDMVSGKARRLRALMHHPLLRFSAGAFRVPPAIAASPETGIGAVLARAWEAKSFVVRGCLPDEDGRLRSLAGQSLSLVGVSREDLPASFASVAASLAEGGDVLVHPYIRTDYGGVIFSAAVSNRAVSQIEFHNGQCSELVSGRVAARSVFIGRRSGAFDGGEKLTAHERELAMRLFILAGVFERYFEYPQDIEWGYDSAARRLYIFQSRDITNFQVDDWVTQEQARALETIERLGRRPMVKLMKESSVYEVTKARSPLTRSILMHAYSGSGSFGKAAALAGAGRIRFEVADIFGVLYEQSRAVKIRIDSGRAALSEEEASRRIAAFRAEGLKIWHTRGEAAKLPLDELMRKLSACTRTLVDEVFPLCFYCNLRASAASGDPARRNLGRYLEALRDLGELCERNKGGNAAREALTRFAAEYGYHAPDPYEVSGVKFVEDADLLKAHAMQYASLEAQPPGAVPVRTWESTREDAKDAAVLFLSSMKPLLIAVAQAAKLEVRDEIYNLDFEIVSELGSEDSGDLAARIRDCVERSSHRRAAFAPVRLSSSISALDVEFLGAWRGETVEQTAKLRIVGKKSAVEGVPVDYETMRDQPGLLPPDAILVVEWLDPALYSYFASALAIVSRRGGELSHLAILGREMDFPVYVGEEVYATCIEKTHEGAASKLIITEDGKYWFRD